jgi:hypothetical protein
MWDDIDYFKLPDPEFLKNKAISITLLAETLIDITNHYVDVAQTESNLKHELNLQKTLISAMETNYNRDLQKQLALNFEKIPPKQQKNRDLQLGWIFANISEFDQTHKAIIEQKNNLVDMQRKLDNVQGRMSAAKHVLDIGRSILSALKAEMENL